MFSNWLSLVLVWGRAGLSWLLVLVGGLGGLYFFWSKAQEESFDLWAAFDGIWLATIGGLLGARLGYVVLHPREFGLSIEKILNLWSYPGMWATSGLLVAVYAMYRFALDTKRDAWEVWDFFSILVAWFLGWWWLSRLVVGVAAGTSTTLPWGMIFPNRLELAHPVQLYAGVGYLLLFGYLWWSEPRYRFFFWYRSKKRTARPGFLSAVFLIASSLLQFGLSFVQPVFFLLPGGFELNQVLGFLLFLTGCVLLYLRSGRSFFARS